MHPNVQLKLQNGEDVVVDAKFDHYGIGAQNEDTAYLFVGSEKVVFPARFVRVAAQGSAPETAWLIERRDRSAIEWLICDSGGFEWTADPLKPIRFSRREDADQVASLFDDIDVHITEHQWGL